MQVIFINPATNENERWKYHLPARIKKKEFSLSNEGKLEEPTVSVKLYFALRWLNFAINP